MATILFGGGVADIRGSIGGTVYARNRAGAFARNRTKPINPNTAKQAANRVRFGNQTSGWTALASSVREAWNALAAGVTRLNKLGQAYTPTGRQIYLESSNNLAVINQIPLTTAPTNLNTPSLPEWNLATIEIDASLIRSMVLSGGSAIGTVEALVKASPPMLNQKNNYSNLYRVVGAYPNIASLNLLPAYPDTFGTSIMSDGTQVSFLISNIDIENGMRSAELRLDGIAAQV